jgi:hypothetical protein
MSRFSEGDFYSGGDDEYDFDYEDGESEYDDDESGTMIGATIPAELMDRWKQSEVSLENQKVHFIVLRQSIKMLEKSWFWRFRSLKSRICLISDTYHALRDLLAP